MTKTKIPYLFQRKSLIFTQANFTDPTMGNKAQEFKISMIVAPFDNCELGQIHDDFERSWFDLILPDGVSFIRYKHAIPVIEDGFSKGDVIGCAYTGMYKSEEEPIYTGQFPARIKVALYYKDEWHPILNFVNRNLELDCVWGKENDSLERTNWDSYEDEYLTFIDNNG